MSPFTPDTIPGFTQPHTHGLYASGASVNIANNGTGSLKWVLDAGGTALLTTTVQTLPTVVTTGIYAITANANGQNFTVGGYLVFLLELDTAGEDVQFEAVSNLANASNGPEALVTMTLYLTAGMALKASVTNLDGVSARDFALSALVQRIG